MHMATSLENLIENYPDFPKKGINFKDITPIFRDPIIFKSLIKDMSASEICNNAEALIAIDARGFLLGSAISLNISKPLILARKPGKLPGELISNSYDLEYGKNSLSIQKDALKGYEKFAIIDDLLATGGTVHCVSELLKAENKIVTGLCAIVELGFLNGREKIKLPVDSQIVY